MKFPMSSDEDYAKHRAKYVGEYRNKHLERARIRRANRTPEQIAEDKRKQAEYRERVRKHNAFLKSQRESSLPISNGKN